MSNLVVLKMIFCQSQYAIQVFTVPCQLAKLTNCNYTVQDIKYDESKNHPMKGPNKESINCADKVSSDCCIKQSKSNFCKHNGTKCLICLLDGPCYLQSNSVWSLINRTLNFLFYKMTDSFTI